MFKYFKKSMGTLSAAYLSGGIKYTEGGSLIKKEIDENSRSDFGIARTYFV